MQSVLSFSLLLYFFFYVYEGIIRYVFNLAGLDSLIFLRDALLIVPLCILFVQQSLRRELHPAYMIYLGIILIHGLVMVLNIGSVMAVAYSAKMLITLLAGALLSQRLMQPTRAMVAIIFIFWLTSFAGILLDKYYVEFPWTGMETTFDDIKVEIGRDWQISGEDKRAGGFTRSSINAATIMPMMALLLMFNLQRRSLRVLVALLTVPALVWTTQKGPILAYMLTLAIVSVSFRNPVFLLRSSVCVMLMLMVGLPVALSGVSMPAADGVFSFESFYQRIEEMWPQAWRWIHYHEAFPFGVGLGGISGAQRLYALNDMNAADNMFILMYAYFGILSFIYLGFIALMVLRAPGAPKESAQALATLNWIITYGCVISILEDQMASLFLGASLGWLCHKIRKPQPVNRPAEIISPRTAMVSYGVT